MDDDNNNYKNDNTVTWDGRNIFYNVLGNIQNYYLTAMARQDIRLASILLMQEYLHIVGYIPQGEKEQKEKKINLGESDDVIDTRTEFEEKILIDLDKAIKEADTDKILDLHFEIKKHLAILETSLGMKLPKYEDPKAEFETGFYG